jgi:aldose 1-epimerase
MAIKKTSFGTFATGDESSLYSLEAGDFRASWSDYGATWTSFLMPDSRGFSDDILLGFPTLDGYARGPNPYFGATVGRYANRIGGSRFNLYGKEYSLYANNGPNHLHGGRRGFDKRLWKADASSISGDPAVRFSRRSPDGEEGYPGSVDVAVTVSLSPSGRAS